MQLWTYNLPSVVIVWCQGTYWGEGGWFRLIRGVDSLNIEDFCSWGVPKDAGQCWSAQGTQKCWKRLLELKEGVADYTFCQYICWHICVDDAVIMCTSHPVSHTVLYGMPAESVVKTIKPIAYMKRGSWQIIIMNWQKCISKNKNHVFINLAMKWLVGFSSCGNLTSIGGVNRARICWLVLQSTSYKCSYNKCYFSLSVTKILLPKILQRESVICYLLQHLTPFFVK